MEDHVSHSVEVKDPHPSTVFSTLNIQELKGLSTRDSDPGSTPHSPPLYQGPSLCPAVVDSHRKMSRGSPANPVGDPQYRSLVPEDRVGLPHKDTLSQWFSTWGSQPLGGSNDPFAGVT